MANRSTKDFVLLCVFNVLFHSDCLAHAVGGGQRHGADRRQASRFSLQRYFGQVLLLLIEPTPQMMSPGLNYTSQVDKSALSNLVAIRHMWQQALLM